MEKKGQIDNGAEFLRLYPRHEKLHVEDMELRKKLQGIKKSFRFDYVSSANRKEVDRVIGIIKVIKSNLVRSKATLIDYECAIMGLRRALHIVNEDIKKFASFNESVAIDELENILLKIPFVSLEKFIQIIIKKTGICLGTFNFDEKTNFINLPNFYSKLKKEYKENLDKYSPAQRRHITNTLISLGRRKTYSNNARGIKNYKNKIFELRDYMSL